MLTELHGLSDIHQLENYIKYTDEDKDRDIVGNFGKH